MQRIEVIVRNHDERRAILQQFIKEIHIQKDYEISITLNASFDQVKQLKVVSTYDGAEIFEEISKKGAYKRCSCPQHHAKYQERSPANKSQ